MSIRRTLALAASAAVIAFGGPSLQAASFLVDDSDGGFAAAGAGWLTTGNDTFIRHNVHFTQGPTDVATYTPSAALGGFTPGNYDLFVQWDVYDGAGGTPATADALYRVNHAGGITDVHINQQQQAKQSAATGLPFANITGSGYYFLGNFALDGSSNVQLSNNGVAGTYLTADALYGTNDGVLIEDLSAKVTFNYSGDKSVFGYPGAAGAAIDLNSVHAYGNGLGDTATYTPGVAGLREVKVSWSAAVHHSSSVTYLVDLDGNLLTTGDQTSTTVDMQRVAANQSGGPIAGSTQTWSDFYSLGTFALTPASTITATNNTGGYITTDQMFLSNVIPEPASVVAVALAGLGMLARRRGR